jgi:AcrR family transcriptional regulator
MRRDAVRNQKLVLAAARDVLSDHGTDATMELVASRAGVGVGTLYRHFPNKEALINELIRQIYTEMTAIARQGLELNDGTGLEILLRAMGRSFSDRRGYASMLVGHTPVDCRAEDLHVLIGKLVEQAREHGFLGVDICLGDVMTLIWAIRGVIETSGATAPTAWERHLDLHLAALALPACASSKVSLSAGQLSEITVRARAYSAGAVRKP